MDVFLTAKLTLKFSRASFSLQPRLIPKSTLTLSTDRLVQIKALDITEDFPAAFHQYLLIFLFSESSIAFISDSDGDRVSNCIHDSLYRNYLFANQLFLYKIVLFVNPCSCCLRVNIK